MNGAIILAAIEAVAQLVKFIGEAMSHGKREWTAEQEAEFERKLEEAFAGGHWQRGMVDGKNGKNGKDGKND